MGFATWALLAPAPAAAEVCDKLGGQGLEIVFSAATLGAVLLAAARPRPGLALGGGLLALWIGTWLANRDPMIEAMAIAEGCGEALEPSWRAWAALGLALALAAVFGARSRRSTSP